jgi:hypothetical protein
MKTCIEMTTSDGQNGDWKNGERGYIDGYVVGGDGRPYAAVVIDERIILAPVHSLKPLNFLEGMGVPNALALAEGTPDSQKQVVGNVIQRKEQDND